MSADKNFARRVARKIRQLLNKDEHIEDILEEHALAISGEWERASPNDAAHNYSEFVKVTVVNTLGDWACGYRMKMMEQPTPDPPLLVVDPDLDDKPLSFTIPVGQSVPAYHSTVIVHYVNNYTDNDGFEQPTYAMAGVARQQYMARVEHGYNGSSAINSINSNQFITDYSLMLYNDDEMEQELIRVRARNMGAVRGQLVSKNERVVAFGPKDQFFFNKHPVTTFPGKIICAVDASSMCIPEDSIDPCTIYDMYKVDVYWNGLPPRIATGTAPACKSELDSGPPNPTDQVIVRQLEIKPGKILPAGKVASVHFGTWAGGEFFMNYKDDPDEVCLPKTGVAEADIGAGSRGTFYAACGGDEESSNSFYGTNVGDGKIKKGCTVTAIPVCKHPGRDGECEYEIIGPDYLDLECWHNKPLVTWIEPSSGYGSGGGGYGYEGGSDAPVLDFSLKVRMFLAQWKDEPGQCKPTFCPGPEFDVPIPIPCTCHYNNCCGCEEKCYTLYLPKEGVPDCPYVYLYWSRTGRHIDVLTGKEMGTFEISGIEKSVYCVTEDLVVSGSTRMKVNLCTGLDPCKAILTHADVTSEIDCTACEGDSSGECNPSSVGLLEDIGWVQVGEDDGGCIFAGCTICPEGEDELPPEDDLLANTEALGLDVVIREGNPCNYYTEDDLTVYVEYWPECCGCDPKPEDCWTLKVPTSGTGSGGTGSWYKLKVWKGTSQDGDERSFTTHSLPVVNGAPDPSPHATIEEFLLDSDPDMVSATVGACPVDGTDGWDLAGTVYYDQDVSPASDNIELDCNFQGTVDCDQISELLEDYDNRWVFVTEHDGDCYFVICAEGIPETGPYPSPEKGKICDRYDTLDFPYWVELPECCACDPPPSEEGCWTAAVPGSAGCPKKYMVGAKEISVSDLSQAPNGYDWVAWSPGCFPEGIPGKIPQACTGDSGSNLVGYVQSWAGARFSVYETCCCEYDQTEDECEMWNNTSLPERNFFPREGGTTYDCDETGEGCEEHNNDLMIEAGWTFLENVDGICYYVWCGEGAPEQPEIEGAAYAKGKPCEVDSIANVKFTEVSDDECCRCDPPEPGDEKCYYIILVNSDGNFYWVLSDPCHINEPGCQAGHPGDQCDEYENWGSLTDAVHINKGGSVVILGTCCTSEPNAGSLLTSGTPPDEIEYPFGSGTTYPWTRVEPSPVPCQDEDCAGQGPDGWTYAGRTENNDCVFVLCTDVEPSPAGFNINEGDPCELIQSPEDSGLLPENCCYCPPEDDKCWLFSVGLASNATQSTVDAILEALGSCWQLIGWRVDELTADVSRAYFACCGPNSPSTGNVSGSGPQDVTEAGIDIPGLELDCPDCCTCGEPEPEACDSCTYAGGPGTKIIIKMDGDQWIFFQGLQLCLPDIFGDYDEVEVPWVDCGGYHGYGIFWPDCIGINPSWRPHLFIDVSCEDPPAGLGVTVSMRFNQPDKVCPTMPSGYCYVDWQGACDGVDLPSPSESVAKLVSLGNGWWEVAMERPCTSDNNNRTHEYRPDRVQVRLSGFPGAPITFD